MPAKFRDIDEHDQRIRDLHAQGLTPIEIAATMSDIIIRFSRPTEGFVKARLRALGLGPNRARIGSYLLEGSR